MSEKRRDSKGRILRTGESQRKDGRYAYKYTDACGKTQFVYAWKLVPTDKTPTGKRDDVSLREKVKEILRDINDGIDTIGKKMTVCQLYARQNSHRKNVKRSTEKGREYLMSVLKEDPLGSRSIDSVKLSDAKEWAIKSRYPDDYRMMLQAWYPALRHSDYVVTYHVRPFSVEEAKALLYTKPQQLSLEEMFLVAQTYEPGSKEFNEVFEIAVRMFPDDPTANLNVACAMIESGQYGRAEVYLAKAGNLPEAVHARGVMAARQGREDEARRLFGQADKAGVKAATENLRLMDME